ncbi:MAG: hypothetical protein M3441_01655 [Chloroflexota bacterium]|nr:hypothetical protein [Chloroflexota bacterium]
MPREGGFSSLELFSLLVDSSSEEWHHKVAPDSPTRLLFSRGHVIKTDLIRASECLAEVRARAAASMRLTRSVGIWHPGKTWFILHAHEQYWPCNITPLLDSVASLLALNERQDESLVKIHFYMRLWSKPASWHKWLMWLKVITLGLKIVLRHRLFIDLSPSNLGFERGQTKLFYLDDELYSFKCSGTHIFSNWHVVR